MHYQGLEGAVRTFHNHFRALHKIQDIHSARRLSATSLIPYRICFLLPLVVPRNPVDLNTMHYRPGNSPPECSETEIFRKR